MSDDKPKMVEGLAHKFAGMENEAFFLAIDAHGGWPVGYQFVGFEHTSERAAGFCKSSHNDGWWTVVASADDYYIWKLTPAALQRVADAAVAAILLPRVAANNLWIKDSRGYRAAINRGITP